MTQPPLLLLHGAIGAKIQYKRLIAAIGDAAEVHTLDFEGHGKAPDIGRPFRATHFVENVITYLDASNLAQVDIFGHSMGGYVALLLAAEHPTRVRRIMTLGVKFAWTPEVAGKQVKNFNPDKILEKVPRFAQMLVDRHGEQWWREHLAKSAESTLDLGANPTVTPELLASVEHPIIISLGDRDNLTTLEESASTARTLPNGALQVFPNTRHPLEQIDPAMVADAALRFFGK